MTVRVVILGAGFGGLELSSRLSEEVPDEVEVTLIDRSESFVFGFSKLDVMFGLEAPDSVRCRYAELAKPGVEFRQETVVAIDPHARQVTTDVDTHHADVLVVALGADLDTAATPGLDEVGHEFYSVAGAERLRDVLAGFRSGIAVIGVLGPFFKCPPAPNEAAFMLHDHLVTAGARDDVDIHLVSPLPSPIPISRETSAVITAMLAERGIHYRPRTLVVDLDPARKVARLSDGGEIPFDLFLGIPVHCAPRVLVEAGMTDDGWMAVDSNTFATRFADVYAIGDVTSAPVPRAGVIAEGQARTVADAIIARVRDGRSVEPYAGKAVCYIETGGATVARVDVDFFAEGGPAAHLLGPSADLAEEKRRFRSTRKQRWFSPPA